MIKLPPPPKQPGKRAKLGEWKAHHEKLREWIHVFEQLESYNSHKYAVNRMHLKELDEDGVWRKPKFKQEKRRKSNPFPKFDARRK